MTTFADLNLIEPLLKATRRSGYSTPTPIQARAIPPLLDGRDVLGCAQTGTGKTAAFSLPVLQKIALAQSNEPANGRRPIRALILSPTRELTAQIAENIETYSHFLPVRHLVIFGGVNANPQIAALRRGVDVLVATPGRLLDLVGQGFIDLSAVEFFVLDEADRMLDMGFIHDIRKVLKLIPRGCQNLLFSATMPPSIVNLASGFLSSPIRVEVARESTTAEQVTQHVMFVERPDKRRLLAHILSQPEVEQSIVFTRTKHGANRLVQQLEKAGHPSAALHGNKSQNARRRALDGFREGHLPTLVATDIAARGIDVAGVSHVFNYDLPNEPESYVHRIGRTGRAGESGIAISFCDSTEGAYLRAIERLIESSVEVIVDHEWHSEAAIPPPLTPRGSRRTAQTPNKKRADGPGSRNGGRRDGGRKARGGRSAQRGDGERSKNTSQEGAASNAPKSTHAQRSERTATADQPSETRRRRPRRRPHQGES
jgi:ATP-dependent RNA helicase RhlE